jgi:hypothetical protein
MLVFVYYNSFVYIKILGLHRLQARMAKFRVLVVHIFLYVSYKE